MNAILPLLIGLLTAAEGYRAEFVTPPTELAEQAAVTVRVRYAVPDGRPAIALHCELKRLDAVVLLMQTATVKGTGEQTFTFDVPTSGTAREITFAAWMGGDWEQSPCGVATAPAAVVLTRAEATLAAGRGEEARMLWQQWSAARTARGLVGIYQPNDVAPASLGNDLARRLTAAGIGAVVLDDDALSNAQVLQQGRFDALILGDCAGLPAAAARPLQKYVEGGGKLVALGGPAFSHARWRLGDRWYTQRDYVPAVAAALPVQVVRDFAQPDIGRWERGSNSPSVPAEVTWEPTGANGTRGAVAIHLERFTGWDTFQVPDLARPFPTGHSWTCFWAKGDATTGELAIEWRETDGSRWIATVQITPEWRPYALPPEAFRYWQDSATKERGKEGDQFRPDQAAALVFGLATTHTRLVGAGEHRFWLDQLGTAPPPTGLDTQALAGAAPDWPRLDTFSPAYKLYPVRQVNRLQVSAASPVAAPFTGPVPAQLFAPHARPQGTGCQKSRRQRFVPLLDAVNTANLVGGSAASLLLRLDEAGGMLAALPVTDRAFFAAPAVADWLTALVARMLDGLFFEEAGAAWYASFGGETIPVGATVRGTGPADVVATITAGGQTVWTRTWALPADGERRTVTDGWPVPADGPDRYEVTLELRRAGQVIDRLTHEVGLWRPAAQPQFIARRNGGLYLGDQRWYPHGVNYMPSSGIGLEDGEAFEYWLEDRGYDPDVIERDLSDCVRIGFNCVSVFQYHRSLASRNLLDLLIRCRRHGLRVNLSLRPGTPLDFPWDLVKEMITAGRLAENDTIFAYDLAWEPFWRNHPVRRPFDALWEEWVVKRHGSVAKAEQAWGHPIGRADGQVTNPTDEQTRGDGPWTKLVLDYRRFQDELLHERYSRARELVRSIDPHHLVSFRMSIGGDPTADPAAMPYEFAGLKDAVDLFEPEGYGRIGDWERVKPGWFTTAYARAVAPELPVVWAEFGQSIWDANLPEPPAERQERAARFYDDFYRMVSLSGADGTICWWFPGGYRVGERSDFGIVNPDRTWRPITEVIHRWALPLTTQRPAPPSPDRWIPIRLGQHAAGLQGLYQEVAPAFWQAVEEGRRPGLRVEP